MFRFNAPPKTMTTPLSLQLKYPRTPTASIEDSFTARAMLCAVYAIVVCMSVCLSVRVCHKSEFY